MSSQESKLTTSDAELIESARSGDTRAFGELWQRHYRSAARVARQCTSSIDADDLVSEAYARIFQRVLAGGGPDGAFRPYLYTTIRNLAATWGAQQSRDIQVDLIDDFEDERIPDDPAAWALDRTLTARAFRSLPERWQTVLWYTEVEGMDPHEVAPLMGMTANGVAALSYRAREGLRKAWLQAHINDAQASGECQFVMGKLGEHSRNGLGERDRRRVEEHLLTCTKCAIVSEEVEEVGSHLAFILLPLILGGAIGGGSSRRCPLRRRRRRPPRPSRLCPPPSTRWARSPRRGPPSRAPPSSAASRSRRARPLWSVRSRSPPCSAGDSPPG
ncbi:hypothetical protein GCM10025881_11500 [Pseudolysinimonas kribbensis]|uniref:RNA polymerase sigma-70 region 2 domain-containing protein n=1 Tax=Pseudolysinimonas kribbensis TaxID=433641 RepID=A0ABQ6K6B8_9MICO|nr:sigma-70 family RNA polymerase sigma factor [Pseudolysinimonas kribbensis]GMA94326.1 hypothetical protein GCM10025881_11500 [Pseudolysinimonas kribbensis]